MDKLASLMDTKLTSCSQKNTSTMMNTKAEGRERLTLKHPPEVLVPAECGISAASEPLNHPHSTNTSQTSFLSLQNLRNKPEMPSTWRLPPEIWEIILDLAVDISISPSGQSNYLTVAYIIANLRSNYNQARLDHSYEDLSLVCRLFKDLLGPSPHILLKDGRDVIHRKARTLYIRSNYTTCTWIAGLQPDHRKCPNITTLDLVCYINKIYEQETSFHILCEKAHALPTVQNLTLRLAQSTTPGAEEHIWSRINDAFPRLASLVVIEANWRPLLNALVLPENKLVTFKSLEILEIGSEISHEGILAPSLRHLSLGVYSRADSAMLQSFPHLESILIRFMPSVEGIDLTSLPRLRLFGFPAFAPTALLPPNRFPSLTHLWLYAGTTEDTHVVKLVEKMPEQMPTVSQITVDLSPNPDTPVGFVEDRSRLVHRLMKCAVVRSRMFTAKKGPFGDNHVIFEKRLVAIR